MSKVPDLPGKLVPRGSEQESWLRSFVGNLCGLSHDRFPGSQPVSFGKKDIDRLELNECVADGSFRPVSLMSSSYPLSSYWVCEKSDGVRVLLTVFTNDQTNEQLVHIVDRHNNYRAIEGIFFPHYEFPERPLRNTIVDAELVIDTDPTSGKETLRMLCFDCLVADNVNVMSKTLEGRYGRLQRHFYEPYAKLKRDFPEMAARHPFDIKVKEVNLSYHLEKVFNIDIPKLQHGNDGLIYTPVATPYVTGTDKNILKWKPPSENSIDFKLVLRFPSLKGQRQPDLHAKPIFALHVWCGGEGSRAVYEPYDVMHVEDDEWENLKSSGEQVDDRIVEVHWDPAGENWRMMRFRDDKPHGNHRNTVESIIQSIADGVERDVLLARLDAVRNAWKLRHDRPAKPNAVQQQQQSQQPHQQAPPPPTQQRASPNLSRVMRFGPLAPSLYSKVGGPALVGNIHR